MSRTLENAPLLESIFELHWKLEPSWTTSSGMNAMHLPMQSNTPAPFQLDKNYRLFLAKISDKLQKEYPVYNPLPQANLPDEMVAHLVQHRFQSEDQVPLVQIGPGVLTVNHGFGYSWGDFKCRIQQVVDLFYESYPQPQSLVLENVSLKYIDGFSLDYEKEDSIEFIRKNLNLDIVIPNDVFGERINQKSVGANIQISFKTDNPDGIFNMTLSTGLHEQQKKLIWQLWVATANHPSNFRDEFDSWLDVTHGNIEGWFFKSLAGDLRKELLNE